MPSRSILLVILALGFVLRLANALAQDHAGIYRDAGGDAAWYLANGYALSSGQDNVMLEGFGAQGLYPVELRNLPTPPLYLLFIGIPQTLLPPAQAVLLARVLQAILSTATLYFAYRLATIIAGDSRAGLITAGALAISPAFVIESAQISTETLYIFLLGAGLWLYVEGILRSNVEARHVTEGNPQGTVSLPVSPGFRLLAFAALLLGLATLTRAVLLLFPLGLALHLALVYRKRSLKAIVLLLGVYALLVSTWTLYNLARWDRLVIGGEGFAAFLYIGASDEGWQGPEAVDEALGQQDESEPDRFVQGAADIIGADPAGYMLRRVSRLAEAVLMPHGTLSFSGPSLRDVALDWLRQDRSPAGLIALTQTEGFWPKLSLYLLQYTAYLAGLAGMWLTRRRWPWTLPLIGLIVYTLLIHLILESIPRYLFPTLLFWWIFAGITCYRIAPWRRSSL